MIGHALSQLLSDLSEIPDNDRTKYEAQLLKELTLISTINVPIGEMIMMSFDFADISISASKNRSDFYCTKTD